MMWIHEEFDQPRLSILRLQEKVHDADDDDGEEETGEEDYSNHQSSVGIFLWKSKGE